MTKTATRIDALKTGDLISMYVGDIGERVPCKITSTFCRADGVYVIKANWAGGQVRRTCYGDETMQRYTAKGIPTQTPTDFD